MIPNPIPTEFINMLGILLLAMFMLILFFPALWELKHPKDAGPRIIQGIAIETVNFFLKNALQNIFNMEDEGLTTGWNVSIFDCLKGLMDVEVYSR